MNEPQYELEFPFLCVTSKAGAYDDQAFVAGVQLGRFYEGALAGLPFIEATVYTELEPTLDLIAMRYGYVLTSDRFDDMWTHITFEKPDLFNQAS